MDQMQPDTPTAPSTESTESPMKSDVSKLRRAELERRLAAMTAEEAQRLFASLPTEALLALEVDALGLLEVAEQPVARYRPTAPKPEPIRVLVLRAITELGPLRPEQAEAYVRRFRDVAKGAVGTEIKRMKDRGELVHRPGPTPRTGTYDLPPGGGGRRR